MINTHYILVGPVVISSGSTGGGSSNVVIESEDLATQESTLYFKEKENPEIGDRYEEFVIINGVKEQIGNNAESISETELSLITNKFSLD